MGREGRGQCWCGWGVEGVCVMMAGNVGARNPSMQVGIGRAHGDSDNAKEIAGRGLGTARVCDECAGKTTRPLHLLDGVHSARPRCERYHFLALPSFREIFGCGQVPFQQRLDM